MTEHVTGVLPVQSDLKSRLELLERSLKDMETRAAAHLGRRLEGTLTSALQITNVPRAVLPSPVEAITVDQEQQQLQEGVDYFSNLDTSTTTDTQLEQKEESNPPSEQDNTTIQQSQQSIVDTEEMMYQIIAHVENELGEAIRRCEKKVELVTEIINEDLLSLIEDRLATRTVALEKRIEELEERLEEQSAAAAAAAVVAVPVKEEEKKKEEGEEEESVPIAVVSVAPEQEKKEKATAQTPPLASSSAPQQQDKEEEEKVRNNNTAKSMPVHVMAPISRMPTPPAKAPPSKPMSRLADPARSSIAKISPSPKKKPTHQLTPRSSHASSAAIKALQEAKAKIAHKQQAKIKEEIAKQEDESTSLGSMLLRNITMLFMFAVAVLFVAVGALSVLVLQGHVKAEDLGEFGGLLEWNFQ